MSVASGFPFAEQAYGTDNPANQRHPHYKDDGTGNHADYQPND